MSKSYRPKYHASVPSGWANDPNGTIFYNGKAHLFFQHYPHKPEWGTMLYEGRDLIRTSPYLVIFPGIAIALAVLSLNLLGDGLRDALDPRLKN